MEVIQEAEAEQERVQDTVVTAEALSTLTDKSTHVETRLMRLKYEVHECVRFVNNIVSVYNDNLSHVNWFANIIVRELADFET